MNLHEYYDQVFLPAWFMSTTKAGLAGFTTAVDQFCAWFDGVAGVDDITDDNLSEFQGWLVVTGRASGNHSPGRQMVTARDRVSQLRQIRRFAQMKESRAPQDMTLIDFYMDIVIKEREFTQHTIAQFRHAIRELSRFWGSNVMLSELDSSVIESWDGSKKKKGLVLSLWRFALKLGYVSKGPDDDTEQAESLFSGGDSLRALLTNKYLPAKMEIRSENTRRQYRFALNDFERYLGHEPALADLTDDNVVGMMRAMESGVSSSTGKKLSAKTINERAGRVKSLWTWLAKRGYVRLFPTTGRLQEEVKTPKAWTQAELRKIFAACKAIDGKVGPHHASHFWTALFSVVWNTGERIGAILAIEFDHLDANGVLTVPATIRKGGRKTAVFMLWPDTLELIDRIREPKRQKIFQWGGHMSSLYNRWRKIMRGAGLDPKRAAFHQIRRTHASWLKAGGGDATAALGHTSAFVTEKSYLDPTIGLQPVKLFKPWDEAS